MSAHTPTPWTEGGSLILDMYGNEIANLKSYGAGLAPQGYVCPWHKVEANAAFIVRAVNAHADLVEALRTILHAGSTGTMASEARTKALATLAKVGGQTA